MGHGLKTLKSKSHPPSLQRHRNPTDITLHNRLGLLCEPNLGVGNKTLKPIPHQFSQFESYFNKEISTMTTT
jgi:hypothetical protein